MRRLRVLFLIDNLTDAGGAERFTLGLATHLPRDQIELWVCITRQAHPAALATLRAAGVRYLELNRRSKSDFYRFATLIRLIRHERFDVLHAHMFGSNLWGVLIGRALGIPVVIAQEHTWSYEGQPIRRWLDGYVIGRLASRFVAVSERDAERMVSVERVPVAKVIMIPSAYVPRAAAHGNVRAELGLDETTPLLGAVAVLRAQKALEVLIDAMPCVIAAEPEAHLIIAGDGPCRELLVSRAHAVELSDRIHFLGSRDDAEAVLRSLDLAVISSDFEGTPLVAYECFATRTPLVATAVGGLPAMVQDGVTGRLVPPRSPERLAEVVTELLHDPDQRRRLASAAAASPARVEIADVAGRFVTLYGDLLHARPR